MRTVPVGQASGSRQGVNEWLCVAATEAERPRLVKRVNPAAPTLV
jgi:hypothetical protein